MKPFAVAHCAYNPGPQLVDDTILTLHPPDPRLGCNVSVYLARSPEEAIESARTYCHALFPKGTGWEQHTVAICDVEKTIQTAEN